MKSLNKVLILGNLTKDPELKSLDSGVNLAKFTVATNRNWNSSKSSEKSIQTDFHEIIAWRGLADICAKYLKKGSAVLVEGRITNSSFKDKEGKNRKKTEIYADEINFINYQKRQESEEIHLVEVPM